MNTNHRLNTVVARIGYNEFPMSLPPMADTSPDRTKLVRDAASDALIAEFDVLHRESVAIRRASMKAGHLVRMATSVFGAAHVHPRVTAQAIELMVTAALEEGPHYVDSDFEMEVSLLEWGAVSIHFRLEVGHLWGDKSYHAIINAKRGGVRTVTNHSYYNGGEKVRKQREARMARALRMVKV